MRAYLTQRHTLYLNWRIRSLETSLHKLRVRLFKLHYQLSIQPIGSSIVGSSMGSIIGSITGALMTKK